MNNTSHLRLSVSKEYFAPDTVTIPNTLLDFTEKANRSIQQLSSILDRSSSEESEGVDRQANPDADGTVDDDSSHQLQESDAGRNSQRSDFSETVT